ncbi:hypothetical protein [Henriciella barbarensis]|jgi:hypothetical protein|nr:hypothetical protein [Henriciella barbarensis]
MSPLVAVIALRGRSQGPFKKIQPPSTIGTCLLLHPEAILLIAARIEPS